MTEQKLKYFLYFLKFCELAEFEQIFKLSIASNFKRLKMSNLIASKQ